MNEIQIYIVQLRLVKRELDRLERRVVAAVMHQLRGIEYGRAGRRGVLHEVADGLADFGFVLVPGRGVLKGGGEREQA